MWSLTLHGPLPAVPMKLIHPSRVNETQWPSILGVDIGDKGGFCGQLGEMLYLKRMPELDGDRAKIIIECDPKVVIAENVHVFPGANRGVVSQGRLMEQKGALSGMCAAMSIPLTFLEPQLWISAYTVKSTKHFKNKDKWKDHLVAIAKSLNPPLMSFSAPLDRWTADAFLIWNFYASIVVNDRLPKLGELNFI